jgi:uncharacterized protein YndB with AHSA1/START domain
MIWAIVGIVFVLLGLVGVVILVGLAVPKGHTATSRILVSAPLRAVWDTLVDFEHHATWRPDVKQIEPRADVNGRRAWIEHNKFGTLPMFVEVSQPPSRMVTRIIEDGMPFAGSWTYELVDTQGGTEVRITEDGIIYNPIFRFMARFLMGYHATMDGYLKNLARKFGGDREAEHERARRGPAQDEPGA